MSFHVVDQGEGMPVILLHGFPDSADLWRHQLPALADAGFRVVAPDLRGFGDSDRATNDQDYFVFNSVADVVGIMDALGIDRAHVVGHDFGSGVGWMLATTHPERVERYVTIAVGHPGAFMRPVMKQMRASWYSFLFQFSGVAEELLARNDWSLFREWLAQSPDIERSIAGMARPGALSAGLGWYRSNMRPEIWGMEVSYPPVAAPVMGIYPSEDFALTEEQMAGSERFVAGPWRYERVEGAGHWVQLEKPEVVNALLLDFLRA